MSIYEALKQDHDRHRDMLARLAETEGDSPSRRELWSEFYYDVGAHAAAEEEAFYSPLMKKEDGQPMGRHSVAEHKELDDIIQELEEMEFSSSGWLTRFKTLRHRYEHHLEEEEKEVFDVARKTLGADKDGAIEEMFHKRKKRERKLVDEKADATPDE
jgi:hemerythrin-like domain-containing protein